MHFITLKDGKIDFQVWLTFLLLALGLPNWMYFFLYKAVFSSSRWVPVQAIHKEKQNFRHPSPWSILKEVVRMRPDDGRALAADVLMPLRRLEAFWWLQKYHQDSILPYLVSGQQCRQTLLLYQARNVWQPSKQRSQTCLHLIYHPQCTTQNLEAFLYHSWLQWVSQRRHLCLRPAM